MFGTKNILPVYSSVSPKSILHMFKKHCQYESHAMLYLFWSLRKHYGCYNESKYLENKQDDVAACQLDFGWTWFDR